MTPQAAQLDAGLAGMGLALPPVMREKLLAYLALLYKWNRTYSLTALRDEHKAVSHHLLDSLAILPFVPSSGSFAGCWQWRRHARHPAGDRPTGSGAYPA
jgi:16S rRNA m(7)G-527 methyltransferase (EC 2.1.1.-)